MGLVYFSFNTPWHTATCTAVLQVFTGKLLQGEPQFSLFSIFFNQFYVGAVYESQTQLHQQHSHSCLHSTTTYEVSLYLC